MQDTDLESRNRSRQSFVPRNHSRTRGGDADSDSVATSRGGAYKIHASALPRSTTQSTTKANNRISSARIPGGAHKKPAATVAPSEVEANKASKKVSPPAPLALQGWGLASYSSSDNEEEEKPKPAAAKKGKASGKPAKGRAPSKNKYQLPDAAQKDQKAEPTEPEELMPGPASGVGELLLSSFDPLADAEGGGGAPAAPRDGAVHLRMQQRNGRKSLTTVQGISAAYNYAKILKDLKRELCCSGIVVEDEDLGSIIQLQGDHRKAVGAFLVKAGMVTKANVKIHGS